MHEVTGDHALLRSARDVGPCLKFLRTPGTKTVKNRTRLDPRPYPGDDQGAETARSGPWGPPTSTSARATCRGRALADSEGNEFDVLTPRGASPTPLNRSPGTRPA